MILPPAFETEIYSTEAGYIGIKQPDSLGDEDSVVLLAAHQLPALIDELQRLHDEYLKHSATTGAL